MTEEGQPNEGKWLNHTIVGGPLAWLILFSDVGQVEKSLIRQTSRLFLGSAEFVS